MSSIFGGTASFECVCVCVCGYSHAATQRCEPLRSLKNTVPPAQLRTRSHNIAQDRTDLALYTLRRGVLLAKWSCRIASGTLVAGHFFDHRVCERRAEFNLEIESVSSCCHHQMQSVASHLALHLYFLH